jgi:hypothetical protein
MLRAIGCLLLACVLTQCSHLGRRATLVYTAVAIRLSPDAVRFTLNRSFIETYKDRVTIETNFTVDESSEPAPNVFDADLHFSGRAPEIGLRTVGEMINASEADSAVGLIQAAAKSRRPLRLTGVWRLWPEHALGAPETQGRPVSPLENPYPDHVFEIHPVTRIEGRSLLDSFHPVEGYRPGAAKRTFALYQDAKLKLRVAPTTVALDTPPSLYNDVHFLMEITGSRQEIVEGGRFVTASALDTEGELLVEGIRMVFVEGSPPERIVRQARRGARLHVWGLPRLSFAEVSRRIRAAGNDAAPQEGPLPYELVILGVYPDEKK